MQQDESRGILILIVLRPVHMKFVYDASRSVEGSVFTFRLLFRLCPPLVLGDASWSSCSSSRFRLEPVDTRFDFAFGSVGCGIADFFFLTLRGLGPLGPLLLVLGGSLCRMDGESLANSDSAGRSATSSAFAKAVNN